jgi:hypothetical protein
MPFPVILAHGALGPYDELIMGGAAVIFLVMMGVSWVRSRNTRPDIQDAVEPEKESAREATDTSDDRFRLD